MLLQVVELVETEGGFLFMHRHQIFYQGMTKDMGPRRPAVESLGGLFEAPSSICSSTTQLLWPCAPSFPARTRTVYERDEGLTGPSCIFGDPARECEGAHKARGAQLYISIVLMGRRSCSIEYIRLDMVQNVLLNLN